MESSDAKKTKLEELRGILINHGLLDQKEEIIVEMMEDLTHFAYFMGCITKKDVKRFLDLNDQQVKEKIKSWKKWNEGNRSCSLSRNPFTEEWKLERTKNQQ